MTTETFVAKKSERFLVNDTAKQIELGLSVVIIGRNEAAHLSECIQAAIQAGKKTKRRFEVIYVDSASTDDSIAIASRYPISVIRISPGEWRCAAAGRAIGARFASGKYVAFIDGDMVCDPLWFKSALTYFNDRYGKVGAVTGKRLDIDVSNGSIYSVKQNYDNVVDLKRFSGAVMISYSAIKASGGYDPYLISLEERELAGRIKDTGFRVIGVPHAMVEHYGHVPGISETLRRKNCGYVIGLGQYVRRLWIGRKKISALMAVKVQLIFWLWIICIIVALAFAGWHNAKQIAIFVACTIPIAIMIFAFRFKNLYNSIQFIFAQPLITKGVIQGLFRSKPKKKYVPLTHIIREGHVL
jgi:glycosyltransferase involved in cell wall biosynthesis